MKIYNRTNQVQELNIYDRNTNLPYSIYVAARSYTELDCTMSAPKLSKLVEAGIFQILGADPIVEKKTPTSEESAGTLEVDTQEEEVSEEPKEEETHEEPESPESVEDHVEDEDVTEFKCDICGGEFASARGLARHKSSAHNS